MDRTKLFRPLISLMLVVFFAQKLAEKFYWYYSIWWFDLPMHFLGGFWEGMLFIWFFSEARLPFLRRPIRDMGPETLWQAILFVFFIGLAWEAGEFLTSNYIGREPWSMLDTASDLLLDLAGGSAALLYSYARIMPFGRGKVQSS